MSAERLPSLINWAKYKIGWDKEVRKFDEFFPVISAPDGILTKPGEEIDPVLRRFITARGSFRLMRKFVDKKPLSEEELRRVREAAWSTSLNGNFILDPLPEGGTRAGITLQNNETLTYLSQNANNDSMLAFLSYWEKNHNRYKPSTSIKTIQEKDEPWILFDFPEAQDVPATITTLYIYTRPRDPKDINKKFSRISLLLVIPKPQTE